MSIIDRPLEFPDAQDRASDGPVEVLDPLGLDDPVQVLIEDWPLTDRPTESLLELLEQAFFLFRPLVHPFHYMVQRHEGVEEGPALLVERRGGQAADAQCQPGERHPGVPIRTDDEIEAAPGPHVEEGHDALLSQAVLGGARQVAPQMDQAADVDVLLAEQRWPAGLRLRLDPGLELDQFPFHDVREGAGAVADLPQLAPGAAPYL